MVSRRHPPGLYVLFFTELWERYSFYSMMAILSLYMNEALQFDVAHVGRVYGAYTAGVYFLPLFGGLLADRVLGFNRAVIAGGVLMMLGHLVLGVESLPFFYAGLVLLACGSGLLKPNVSTLVGNLYRDRPELRDQGFNIFYMGINLGAFISPLTVSWLRTHYGWGPAFMSAAGAMVISLLVFIVFNRHVADAAVKVEENSVEARALSPEEARSRVLTLVAVFAISMVFWLAFYQIFYTFTFWARDNTLTTIPPERFQVFEPLGVILLSPVLVAVWRWLQRRNAEPSTPVKMLLGVVLVAIAFGMLAYAGMTGGDAGRVSAQWLIWANVIIALGEISLSPMGLSLVNMLAPPRNRGLLMGGWFASLATGGYLAGYIGGYWDRMPHSRFFLMVTLILIATAVPLSLMTLQIKRTIARSQTVPVGQ
ncbi:MAG: MFS transporter [Acidobacteria bacterium]|nr:MAG: MFS transporter [Acidobacteriota bacterium]PYR19157.1 MAG: MFS transporter [Acidobacteriota bacterium]PYR45616.1 MAG: MFS transporter [Acidobacteriota bacterium]